jgi:hypothetical protein
MAGLDDCRAAKRLANDVVVTEGACHPAAELGANGLTKKQRRPPGRATSVPFTAVLHGPQRTTTDSHEAASTCATPRLRR